MPKCNTPPKISASAYADQRNTSRKIDIKIYLHYENNENKGHPDLSSKYRDTNSGK